APPRPRTGAGPARPLEGPTLSRRHARVWAIGDGLAIERLGRATMALDGEPATSALTLTAGKTVLLGDELLLLCERRPLPAPSLTTAAPPPEEEEGHPFGAADPQGLVGETPAFGTVRERIRFAAGTTTPLLVTGAPGSGREAIARAVHALSPTPTPLVAIDGEALRAEDLDALASRDDDAPTLLVLDIGEMPGEMQAQLARFATRLMSRPLPRPRLVATTTHDNEKVRPTLSARFPLVIRVPELAERRADVPLIARALLRAMAEEQPSIAERFFRAPAPGDEPAHGEPRLGPRLVTRLVRHPFPGQVHELHSVLWRAAMTSPGNELDLTPEVEAVLAAYAGPTVPSRLSPDVIRAALVQTRGKVSEAARRLGLNSRFQLYRLMEKYDIKPS
ncbi:MAG: sigma 54-interacting transcriptional regulator, partial [Deltaproteobacteria bacterium]|nr:sigma 54-interacting transcriptional regulator [Deltaproteobacteria bacterium]